MFGQSLLSAFGIACTTDTDQLFTTNQSATSIATYQLNSGVTSIPNNTYPGTATSISYAAGKFGNAAVFDGSSSDIIISGLSSMFSTKAAFTVSLWFKTTATGNRALFDDYTSNNYNIQLYLYDGILNVSTRFSGGDGNMTASSTTYNDGNWHHVAVTSNQTTYNTYVDGGSPITWTPSSNSHSGQTPTVTTGASQGGTVNFFSGEIDQLRIFNSALPQSAITALYNETTTTATSASINYQLANPNSIAYYKMSNATDQLGNYNGTATNVNFNTEGKFGFAGAFNGSSSVIDLGTSSSFSVGTTGSLSLSLWVKTTATSTGYLMSKANDATIQYEWALEYNGSQLQLNVFNTAAGVACGSGYNTTNINDGNWHHVSGVITNNTSVSLYIDNGNPITSTSWSGTTAGPFTISTLIGHFAGIPASTSYWEGDVDQIRIYDAALSAANVSTLYKEVECQPAAINALDQFNTVLYTGTNGNQSISSLNFKPGLTWIKSRDYGYPNLLADTLRGAGSNKMLISDFAGEEGSTDPNYANAQAYGYISSLDTNGFSLASGTTNGGFSGTSSNVAGSDYVSWNWKAPLVNLSTNFNGSSSVGSASRIDLTGSTTLTTRSISLWVNLAGTGSGGNLILDNSDGQNPGVVQYGKWVIQLQYGGTNYFAWDTYNGSSYGICDVNYTFNLNTWYHIVFVAEANNQAVYINGVSQTLQNVSRPGDIGTVTMSTNRLGASWSTQYTHALNGTMGQVRIFNDALTASEVADLYAEPVASNNTLNYPAGAGCIAAYPLQTDAVDLSGNYSGASSNVTFGQPGYLTSNTDGTITSTVAANVEAGFSIVSYTATGSTATVGHGLGTAPDLILAKTRNQAYNWIAYSSALGSSTQLLLDSANPAQTGSSIMASTDPTSTVFTAGAGNNLNYANGNTIIAYCFTSIPGYSKIGSYSGTGSSTNTIYTNFEPSFLLVKNVDTTTSWVIFDNKRSTSNTRDEALFPNLASAEYVYSNSGVNFNSTGFSLTQNVGEVNGSGNTYIFLAIA